MLFKAKVLVTLRKSILDVQGKAVLHALQSLSYTGVKSARIGSISSWRLKPTHLKPQLL